MTLKDVSFIDPVFKIPTGAEDDFEYSMDRLDSQDIEEPEENPDIVSGLATPDTFTIISQKIRRGDGNQQVVDVVFETEAIPGAIKYEVRVAKV
jgi:hypothetical protein